MKAAPVDLLTLTNLPIAPNYRLFRYKGWIVPTTKKAQTKGTVYARYISNDSVIEWIAAYRAKLRARSYHFDFLAASDLQAKFYLEAIFKPDDQRGINSTGRLNWTRVGNFCEWKDCVVPTLPAAEMIQLRPEPAKLWKLRPRQKV